MRRSILVVSLALASLSFVSLGAAAQGGDLADHPIVGAWMASTPFGPGLSSFSGDGTVVIAFQATQGGPQGVAFVSPAVGTWQPTSERGVHFTVVQIQSDASGNLIGTVTIDGNPVVSQDGTTQTDDSPDTSVTIRDAAGNVLDVITGGPPITGTRMAVGDAGFPETPAASCSPTT